MRSKKTPPVKIRLVEGDDELARELADATKLDMIYIFGQVLHAGLVAVKANGLKLTFPLKFVLDDGRLQAVPAPPIVPVPNPVVLTSKPKRHG